MLIKRRLSLDAQIAAAEKKKHLSAEGVVGIWNRDSNIMAIDFETAHYFKDIYNKQYSSACQVGIAYFDASSGEIKTVSSFIKPEPFTMDNGNFQIHGISLESLVDAPSFNQVYEDLIFPYIQKSKIILSHNAPFDTRVLFNALNFYELDAPNTTFVCTLSMAKKFLKLRKNSLDTICTQYNIELNHHEATSDALACFKIFEKFSERGFEYCGRSIEKMMQSKS